MSNSIYSEILTRLHSLPTHLCSAYAAESLHRFVIHMLELCRGSVRWGNLGFTQGEPVQRFVVLLRGFCVRSVEIEMVEAAGIEPASESASTKASTCVAVLLDSPPGDASGPLPWVARRSRYSWPEPPSCSNFETRCRRLSPLAGDQG